ncbi:MAG: hypothetical protein IPJ30_16180 [Acidobacteria bacterium]|nr:hypothetical protein [Acidobacteriota bacterium]
MNGFDQIADLIEQIEANPNSRRLIVSGWNPPTANNVDLPPCQRSSLWVENENPALPALPTLSADAFLGVPFNISSYALLTEMIAHVWTRSR